MADKNSTLFLLKSFQMNLAIMPNFGTLTKALRDMVSGLPKAIQDELHTDKLTANLAEYKKANTFEDARNAYTQWVATAITGVEKLSEDKFAGKRGRDVTNLKLTIFGQLKTVPEHVGVMIAGSQLATILEKGPKAVYAEFKGDKEAWQNLNTVFNSLKAALTDTIPEEGKNKRKTKEEKEAEKKAAEDAKNAEANANAENGTPKPEGNSGDGSTDNTGTTETVNDDTGAQA